MRQTLGVHAQGPGAVGAVAPVTGDGRISQAGELRSARIESLRAIAALGVMLGHVWGSANAYGLIAWDTFPHRILFGGGYGVYVFFALSGYLLFWPFAKRDFGGGAPIDLRRYAINRALRILPLYYVVVVVLLVLQEHGGTATQWKHFLTWTETFSSSTFDTVDGAVWSLVVELHFYALLPLVALAVGRVARASRVRAGLALLALGVASYLAYKVIKGNNAGELWAHSLPAMFYFFVPGMLLALIRLSWQERPPWRLLRTAAGHADVWLLTSVALWLVVFYDYNYPLVLVAAASFLMVGACVLPLREGRLVGALGWKPLATLGIASYSLYLWHMPLIQWITGTGSKLPSEGFLGLIVRVVPLAIVVALASYAFIEAPFLRLRRRWSPATPPSAVTEPPVSPSAASPLAPAE
jgi:peptidoglycan/LPS O-acetylase OafA/YrhL